MTEDLDVFFSDLGVGVEFGSSEFKGLLDMPDEVIGGGMVISTEYVLTVKSSDVSGLKDGDQLTVDGTLYEVRAIRAIDNGALTKVTLSKV